MWDWRFQTASQRAVCSLFAQTRELHSPLRMNEDRLNGCCQAIFFLRAGGDNPLTAQPTRGREGRVRWVVLGDKISGGGLHPCSQALIARKFSDPSAILHPIHRLQKKKKKRRPASSPPSSPSHDDHLCGGLHLDTCSQHHQEAYRRSEIPSPTVRASTMMKTSLLRQAAARRAIAAAAARPVRLALRPSSGLLSLSRPVHPAASLVCRPVGSSLPRFYSSESAAAEATEGSPNGPITQFKDMAQLGVHERIVSSITDGMGYQDMTAVQSMTINAALAGKDV